MTWWDRITAIFRREAADVKEGLAGVGKALDAELARKEREQSATPEERIDMILEEQAAGEARLDDLSDRILGADPPEDDPAET